MTGRAGYERIINICCSCEWVDSYSNGMFGVKRIICGHRQKLHSSIYGGMLKLAGEQDFGTIRQFVEYWVKDEVVRRTPRSIPRLCRSV